MRRRWLWVPCVGLLASCVESSGAQTPPTTAAEPSTSVAPTTTAEPTTTTTIAPTTTAAPITTTIPPVPISGTLGQGAKGPEVALVQQRLLELHFDPGEPDGKFDTAMTQSVWAYQKLAGGPVDGQVTPELWLRMQQPFVPKPLVEGGEPDRVEIDLPRQVLITYKGGNAVLITHISTGRSASWPTPGGRYAFTWRWNGWRTSRLGRLYNPVYFNRGIAVHGAKEVPSKPASHGCVRIPMHIAEYFPDLVVRDEPVYVQDGFRPFNSPLPMPDSLIG